MTVLAVRDLRFAWPGAAEPVIDIAQLEIAAGEAVFLHGPSGCGKSTLLSLMAGVLLADAGQVTLLDRDWAALSGAGRDRSRVDHVGYIFQQFNLLPYLSAIDNVLLPCRFSQRRDARAARDGSARQQAGQLLSQMGLDNTLWVRPAMHLSVGQQQRVAAARALIGQPELVIADEPTSALDEDRREAFLDVLLAACTASGSALVFVSHDQRIAARFGRHILLPEINRAARP
ncbi:MAG: ABC transporter ATP-binding protein [Variovorax sp.]|nr:MAG: ABC transporter ATP-binding protein [Variovorax sp.]